MGLKSQTYCTDKEYNVHRLSRYFGCDPDNTVRCYGNDIYYTDTADNRTLPNIKSRITKNGSKITDQKNCIDVTKKRNAEDEDETTTNNDYKYNLNL